MYTESNPILLIFVNFRQKTGNPLKRGKFSSLYCRSTLFERARDFNNPKPVAAMAYFLDTAYVRRTSLCFTALKESFLKTACDI